MSAARNCGSCRNGYPGTEAPCLVCKDASGWAPIRVAPPTPRAPARRAQPGQRAAFQTGMRRFLEGNP